MHQLWFDVFGQPGDEFIYLLALMTVFAFENRDGQIAEVRRFCFDGEARYPAQQGPGVKQTIDEPRCMAKETDFLLKIDVNAAEKNALAADIRLIGAEGGIRGHQERIVSLADEGGHQGIVVQTGAAKHAAGPRSDIGDAHTVTGYSVKVRSFGSGRKKQASEPTR